jgi:hypothetical protein
VQLTLSSRSGANARNCGGYGGDCGCGCGAGCSDCPGAIRYARGRRV